MAKIRSRSENGMLFMDFYYRGTRCREQTALSDTAENRKKVQSLLNRVSKEIAQGSFNYEVTFPDSPNAQRFNTTKTSDDDSVRDESTAPPSRVEYRAPTPSFQRFAEQWFVEMSPEWRGLHRSCVRGVLDKNLLPVFGNRPVGEISKAEVLAFRAQIVKLPGRHGSLGNARINKIMCFLRQILNEAADRFDVTPAFRSVKPLKQKKSDVQPFSLDEVRQILDTVRPDYRNYLIVRFFTGMRTGEINGLQWKYVDLERNLILVRETVVAGQVEEDAKNRSSLRDIPMQPMVRDAIVAQRDARSPDVAWVFPSREGGPIDTHNFTNRVWYPLLRYLELDKRRPYQTRHTAATLMLAAGENPEWIARILGHANTDMLFRVYSRYVPNLTRQDGRAFAGLIHSRSDTTQSNALNAEQIETMDTQALRQALKLTLRNSNRPPKPKEENHVPE